MKSEIEIAVCSPKERIKDILKKGVPPKRILYVPGETDKDDKISALNPWYCEATALHWIWKHSKADIVGLEHYRRFFVDTGNKFINEDQILQILDKVDVIVAEHKFIGKPDNYPIVAQSIVIGWEGRKFQAYKMIYGFIMYLASKPETYELAKFFLNDLYDEQTFFKCNMFVARKKILDEWCEFMFPELDAWFKKDKIKLDKTNERLIGYVFEHLFGSWLKWKKYKLCICPHIVFDKELKGIDPVQMGVDGLKYMKKPKTVRYI